MHRRLNPGGVMTLFIQLYQCNEAAAKSEIGTFMEAFPNGVVFESTGDGVNFDLVMVGKKEPVEIDVAAWEAKLRRPDYAPVARSLREVGFDSAREMLSSYVTSGPDLKPWLQDAQINHDRDLRLQYLAGMGLNERKARPLIEALRRTRRTPPPFRDASPGGF